MDCDECMPISKRINRLQIRFVFRWSNTLTFGKVSIPAVPYASKYGDFSISVLEHMCVLSDKHNVGP